MGHEGSFVEQGTVTLGIMMLAAALALESVGTAHVTRTLINMMV